MQLRAVGRRCSTGAATVLGDIAQGTTPWATVDWSSTLAHLGKPGAHIEVLDRGYRVPGVVIDFASRLLPHIAAGVAAPVSVRENPGTLELVQAAAASDGLAEAVALAVRAALELPGSVGVIAADVRIPALARWLQREGVAHHLLGADQEAQRVALVPAGIAKGLEYDQVVVVEPAEIVAAEPRGLRRLYVVLTRAVSALTVVHAQPLPPELAA
jgi:DNA helicase IV